MGIDNTTVQNNKKDVEERITERQKKGKKVIDKRIKDIQKEINHLQNISNKLKYR